MNKAQLGTAQIFSLIFFKRLYPDHDNERHNNPEQTRVASWSAENAETISSVLKPGTLASISGVIDAANKKSSAIENLAALEGLQQGTF